ncbi:histidine kinase [Dactylosporangium sp. AC04546]|uniref:sensor histidine kinase n=1 Tax=Dactylosporangium sp. AC04546 TaxID=2862460 RepID=UPI001EE0E2FE|nr:histidine kinase [Dactylosporangium sp. AC04546]WVK87787.1 histidine kinase [Dactylosporangium sp. AC04546]
MSLPGFVRMPSAAAVALGTAAAAEAVLRGGRSVGDLMAALALALCATLPIAFVRTRLVPVAVAATGATLVTLALGERPAVAAVVAQTAALYFVGARTSGRVAQLFALPYVACAIAQRGVVGVGLLVVSAGALAVGAARRDGAESADRREAAHQFDGLTRAYAVHEERARIARELHDVVAHHISMLSVQAETTRLATPGLPELAATRLQAIGETARMAMTELRRVLGVLREDTTVPEVLPQPGLAELLALTDEAREAGGSRVHLIVRGRYRPLDPGLELTAYRIVQEALTNTRRHASGAAVDVEVTYGDETLALAIWNTGGRPAPRARPARPAESPRTAGPAWLLWAAWPAGAGAAKSTRSAESADSALERRAGYGLLGMRERVAMAGGTLQATHGPFGGFAVRAVLPVPVAGR